MNTECDRATEKSASMVWCETSKATVNSRAICGSCKRYWIDGKPPMVVEENLFLRRTFPCANKSGTPGSPLPGYAEMVSNFVQAMWKWASWGFKVVSKTVFDSRVAICNTCNHFNKPRPGVCGLCRCHKIKMHLASTRCDIGKWGTDQ